MNDLSELVEARVSAPTMESARHIAEELVARKVAACVQILGPMTSIYSWSGQVHESKEWLLLVKTTRRGFAPVCEVVQSLHAYEVPEIMAVPVVDALEAYAGWVSDQLGESDRPGPASRLGQ